MGLPAHNIPAYLPGYSFEPDFMSCSKYFLYRFIKERIFMSSRFRVRLCSLAGIAPRRAR